MSSRISVFGCGWLGFPLAKSLLENGLSVKGSTTSDEKLQELKSNGIQPFLLKLEELPNDILDFLSSEILIINIPSKNVEGFNNLIPFIEKSLVKKVLFISSTSVYEPSDSIITEETGLRDCPLKDIEELFQKNENFETTILRFSGLLGYQRKPGNWFKNGKIIPNPEGVVNMIHQDDCISIIEKIISNNCWNDTYNAATDSHPSRRNFYTKAFQDVGNNAPIFNEEDKKTIKIIGNNKVKKELKFEFKYSDLLNLPID